VVDGEVSKKPMTNGDYIRNMTDEEIILRLDICPRTFNFHAKCLAEDCDTCQAEWLKMPHKGGQTDEIV
jgi:hypothetical protein